MKHMEAAGASVSAGEAVELRVAVETAWREP
jgi:hypothetical protein